jgi:hypothetical protein
MLLAPNEIEAYLAPLHADQQASIRELRELIHRIEPALVESVCDGKWWTGYLLYSAPICGAVYALGPLKGDRTTLHLLPYYASAAFQARHGAALKKFLTGKSCIAFRHAADLPIDALTDIMTGGANRLTEAISARDAARKKK